ncbi:MAG TPA: protein-L-isoaspartate(D-aspartate) O-methyltransferase [bacterium]|nr:protein-L-isoaspartate(D-aspartate) O-methyltransferase [bacterium]HOL95534.1 protein-L-isoaspartate(D-aspartate) O-methyltransferase [bacterium]HPP02328.1 protein-L-isoaspartate(D-aspartate) O-methyltransferase [bacterium]HXK94907.1 protein-L-isoaspartate(D-aspartate) O-methyltransferase [bacterium]
MFTTATPADTINWHRNHSGKIMDHLEKQILDMLQHQIVARGIDNPKILEAMQRAPRHLFVPPGMLDDAYQDHPIALPEDRTTISQPYMVAYMTDALDCQPADRVLEIGTGSGYQAAVLAHLCQAVYTVERYGSLSENAQRTIQSLGLTNVFFRTGDGCFGWPEQAPFDKIVVTAAVRRIPRPLLDQLADPGILLIPVGDSQIQTLVRIQREGNSFRSTRLIPCVFVPMISNDQDLTQADLVDSVELSSL